jgi:2-polyprenyl-3-methyl-5-hydroxy-6-metoxy-1,4-benzoquinol methylase
MPIVVDPDGVEPATIRELIDVSGLRVVDVGCGYGRLSFACARDGAEVYGFDSDEESIAKAQSETPRALRRRIRFEVAHAAEAELPRGEFDLALFSWSL